MSKIKTSNVTPRTTGGSLTIGEPRSTTYFHKDSDVVIPGYATKDYVDEVASAAPHGNPVFHLNDNKLVRSYTIPEGKNAGTFGELEMDDNVDVHIPEGSTWTIVGNREVGSDGSIALSDLVDTDIPMIPQPDAMLWYDEYTGKWKPKTLSSLPPGEAGKDGDDGKSAYEIYAETTTDSPVKTVQEWLDSLQGEDGKDGQSSKEVWLSENPGSNEDDYWAAMQGPKGDQGLSSFEVWLESNPGGTEEEYWASLEGPQGQPGPGFDYKGNVASESDLPNDSGNPNSDGDAYFVEDVGELFAWGADDQWHSLGKIQGEQGDQGLKGDDGDSAYEVWLKYNPGKSEAEYLASLKGETGDKGEDGLGQMVGVGSTVTLDAGEAATVTQNPSLSTQEKIILDFGIPKGLDGTNGLPGDEGAPGADGDSAYELWLAAGNSGSEQDFLDSIVGDKGDDGDDGLSAYEIALDNGFSGTEEEWLKSLVGEKGDQGDGIHIKGHVSDQSQLPPSGEVGDAYGDDNGDLWVFSDSGTWVNFGHVQGPAGENGDPGKSAYASALDAGFQGSEEEWIASLKGDEGEPGESIKGDPGDDGKSAYEIAVEQGFQGDEAAWLESLKGEDGLLDDETLADIQDNLSQINSTLTPSNDGTVLTGHVTDNGDGTFEYTTTWEEVEHPDFDNSHTDDKNNVLLGKDAELSNPNASNEIVIGNENNKAFRIPGTKFEIVDPHFETDQKVSAFGWEIGKGFRLADQGVSFDTSNKYFTFAGKGNNYWDNEGGPDWDFASNIGRPDWDYEESSKTLTLLLDANAHPSIEIWFQSGGLDVENLVLDIERFTAGTPYYVYFGFNQKFEGKEITVSYKINETTLGESVWGGDLPPLLLSDDAPSYQAGSINRLGPMSDTLYWHNLSDASGGGGDFDNSHTDSKNNVLLGKDAELSNPSVSNEIVIGNEQNNKFRVPGAGLEVFNQDGPGDPTVKYKGDYLTTPSWGVNIIEGDGTAYETVIWSDSEHAPSVTYPGPSEVTNSDRGWDVKIDGDTGTITVDVSVINSISFDLSPYTGGIVDCKNWVFNFCKMKNGYPLYISWDNYASNPVSLSYKINGSDAKFSSSHTPPSSMAPGEKLSYKFTCSSLLDPTKRSPLSFAEGFGESASTGGGGGGGGYTGGDLNVDGQLTFDGRDGAGFQTVAIGDSAGAVSQGDTGIAIGFEAGYQNQGVSSIAIGQGAGGDGQGPASIAIGYSSGSKEQAEGCIAIGNIAGQEKQSQGAVAIGFGAGAKMLGRHAVAIGNLAAGEGHIPTGYNSPRNWESVSIGLQAGNRLQRSNTVAIGARAGEDNQDSDSTLVGSQAGEKDAGYGSTAVGYRAGHLGLGRNSVCLGAFSEPSTTTAAYEITLGNTSIAALRCAQTSITAVSDERDKSNISDIGVGLAFIDALRPRTWTWNYRPFTREKKREEGEEKDVRETEEFVPENNGTTAHGFVAQELKEVQERFNAPFLNLVYESNPDRLEATPGNLLPVAIKAIQELSAGVKALKAEIAEMKSFDTEIGAQVAAIDFELKKNNGKGNN